MQEDGLILLRLDNGEVQLVAKGSRCRPLVSGKPSLQGRSSMRRARKLPLARCKLQPGSLERVAHRQEAFPATDPI